MKYVDEFRDGTLARGIAARIAAEVQPGRQYRFMEFCGGHTHAISRYGIAELLPPALHMIHGPGCPVCVLPIGRIDLAIGLALERGAIVCTYGDTMRVPASQGLSLLKAKARGGDIRMVYSAADALKIAAAGGIPLLVARGMEKLEETKAEIEAAGGTAYVYSADLSDMEAIDDLVQRMLADHPAIDMVVNNAGRSIRRSIALSLDRFHDFERTMQLNYFGAIRLVMGLMPHMKERRFGHVVNVSSIGVQTNPPRFSAYVASKSALDAWTRVVSSELIGDNITFTTIHMPLVRTPMIAPTKMYDSIPTLSPDEAGDLVCEALRRKPKSINTRLGTFGEVSYALAPKAVDQILHTAYKVFPDSAAAKGEKDPNEKASMEQIAMANLMKGVHW